MEVKELKAKIQSRKVPHFLIFVGDEWEVQKIYIQQIETVMNLEHRRIDCVRDVLHTFRHQSFVTADCLYVVRDDKEFISSEKLQNKVQNTIGNSILILMFTKLDKRTKFYNSHKGIIVEFQTLAELALTKYIQKQIPLSNKNCQMLIEVCESNYGRILLEIDKIKRYYQGYRLPADGYYDSVLEDLLKDGTIYKPPKDAIFDLVDAILRRDVKSTFDLLQQSYAVGEATLVILSVLFNNAKAVLQVQTCTSKDVGKSTGLTGWQIMNANKLRGHYKEEELIKMLHLIKEVETGIKTGKIEDKFAMQYLLTEVL